MQIAPGSAQGVGRQLMSTLGQMPNKGQTPITMFVDIKQSPKPQSTFTLQVPAGTLTDLGFLVNRILSIVQQATP